MEQTTQTTVTNARLEEDEPIRINRYIALCGVTSRRKADNLIEQGRVQINGRELSSSDFGERVTAEDVVRVDGERISPHPFLYLLVNKPENTITTTDDPRGRRTVLDLIEDDTIEEAGVFPVGRLDKDTTGLLLLTNDGILANRMMHPRYEVLKQYRVVTGEPLSDEVLERLRAGVTLDDGPASADRLERSDRLANELYMDLHEGRNRQIRRMITAVGHEVVDLERIQYAGLTLEGIDRGHWRWLEDEEVQRLERQLDVR
jgi:23S rRNA pseudouridine2605 synthase